MEEDILMKANLSFNLEDPQDKLALNRALSATDAYIVLHSYLNKNIRDIIKYNSDKYSEETINMVYELRDGLYALLDEYKVDLEDLE
jgi:hypothetical protein